MAKKPASSQAEQTPPALVEILEAVRELAGAREALAEVVGELNAGIEALKADGLPEVRRRLDAAAAHWSTVLELLKANAELFVRPRSLQAHGIKFGYQKGKGSVEIADADRTVVLIKRHLPEQAGVLIITKETPAKDALTQLSVADLKKIGVEVKDTGDQVFIKPAEGAVDKLVKALVSAAVEGEA